MPVARTSFTIQEKPVLTSKTFSDGKSGYEERVNRTYYCTESSTGTTRRKPSTPWIDPTAYTFERIEIVAPTGYCLNQPTTTPSGGSGQYWRGCVGYLPGTAWGRFSAQSHFNAVLSEATVRSFDWGLRNAANIAARQKLKSIDINLGVAFAERKRTAMLVGDTASRLGKAVIALGTGRPRHAMNILGITSRAREPRGSNVPKKWLELQYGWKPLLSDVYGAVDALSKHPSDHWLVTAKATRAEERTYSYTSSPTISDAHSVVAVVRQSCQARIDAMPTNEATISLASLGITNPLTVAWELVPYSFVVDWFLPIGSFVDSLDAMLGYTGKAYVSSLWTEAHWTDTGTSYFYPDGRKIVNVFTGTKRMVRLVRQVQKDPPLPSLPRFKDPRSLGHMANGLSLLASAFGRR